MARVEIRSGASQGVWQRNSNPVFPISRIEYTPTTMLGGISLVGDFTVNRGAARSKSHSEILKSVKVRGNIPRGMVLTFKIGEDLFGVMFSEVDERNLKRLSHE
jgi:hypothetical protein